MRRAERSSTDQDRAIFSLVAAFLEGRLRQRPTFEWVLRIPEEGPAREAVRALVDRARLNGLEEPWRTAWSLVEEFWRAPPHHNLNDISLYRLQQRFEQGERTGSLINELVLYFRPRLDLSEANRHGRKASRPVRSVTDIFHASITSEHVVDPKTFHLDAIDDGRFLSALARGLESAVDHGIDLAERLGWNVQREQWRLGFIHRVYFAHDRSVEDEPDEFATGLAPAVKLLHAVVERLAVIEPNIAAGMVRSWFLRDSLLYSRLWSALSFSPAVTQANEVGQFLRGVPADHFWNVYSFPEIAELRARRFGHLSLADQQAVLRRLRVMPSPRRWRSGDPEEIAEARRYWKARELRRIEVAGWELPPSYSDWLADELVSFPELSDMRLDHDFDPGVQVYSREANPDRSFDGLVGTERLSGLELALNKGRRMGEDPSERAGDWIRTDRNVVLVLNDLQSDPGAGSSFPSVWARFSWAYKPTNDAAAEGEISIVLALLLRLSDETIRAAIEGITHLLSDLDKQANRKEVGAVWLRVWPLAVEETNAQQPDKAEEFDLGIAASGSADREPMDLDTLNTPVGRLVGVFLQLCPNLRVEKPFANPDLRKMRDLFDEAAGRSGMIVRYRLLEHLSYFLRADRAWAEAKLIPWLDDDGQSAAMYWRATTRQGMAFNVTKKLGRRMVARAGDESLSRDTRKRIVFRLVVDALDAQFHNRKPAVAFSSVQQMIRMVDPEIRANGAEAVSRFLKDHSSGDDADATPEALYERATAPFMTHVWPQERSLATPGISKAFADIPANAKERFASAVDLIERFLVPFDCWSMNDYGLYGNSGDEERLALINSPPKAEALLRLLDSTVGTAEGAVVPNDLGSALQQVRSIAPSLAETPRFRRLAAAARL